MWGRTIDKNCEFHKMCYDLLEHIFSCIAYVPCFVRLSTCISKVNILNFQISPWINISIFYTLIYNIFFKLLNPLQKLIQNIDSFLIWSLKRKVLINLLKVKTLTTHGPKYYSSIRGGIFSSLTYRKYKKIILFVVIYYRSRPTWYICGG